MNNINDCLKDYLCGTISDFKQLLVHPHCLAIDNSVTSIKKYYAARKWIDDNMSVEFDKGDHFECRVGTDGDWAIFIYAHKISFLIIDDEKRTEFALRFM